MVDDGSAGSGVGGPDELVPGRVYLAEEVAEHWRVSLGYVRGLCRSRELRAVKFGGSWRITGKAAVEYWESQEGGHESADIASTGS